MPDEIRVTAVNFDVVQEGFRIAPDRAAKFARQELDRFAKRVRKRVIQGMSGRKALVTRSTKSGFQFLSSVRKSPNDPLYGGQFKKGGHIKARAGGTDLNSLYAVTSISRILRVHEEGATITPKQAGFLFLSRKSGTAGGGHIFARVKSVTIPPRLGFEKKWNEMVPDGTKRVESAINRAVVEALTRKMKAVSAGIASITS